MEITEAIRLLVAGQNLSIEQTKEVFYKIMSGEATPAQIAALLVALRIKGETVDEITAAAQLMREKATRISVAAEKKHVLDTCGTGGDNSNTFNISTAVAFVAAGAGAIVAKHGNRSVSSRSGSADVLEALGVNILLEPKKVEECIERVGIGFLFAPSLHTAMKYAIGPRKEIGIRTIFNIIGPLTNPAFASAQLLGVYSAHLTQTMANVLKNIGVKKAFVVHGLDPIDEVSISGESQIAELSDGSVKCYNVRPEDFGLKPSKLADIAGGNAVENALIIRKILDGEKGPCRDITVLNAGFAIAAASLASSVKEGIVKAQQSIDSGAARAKLDLLIKISNSC